MEAIREREEVLTTRDRLDQLEDALAVYFTHHTELGTCENRLVAEQRITQAAMRAELRAP